MDTLLKLWDLPSDEFTIIPITDGLINATYKIEFASDKPLILQQINRTVFNNPKIVCENYSHVYTHLSQNQYPFALPVWLRSKKANLLEEQDGRYYRLGEFLQETETRHMVSDGQIAFEVGRAFAYYDKALINIESTLLQATITDFHHLTKYLTKLDLTFKEAGKWRIEKAQHLLDLVDNYKWLLQVPFPKSRIIHNDAKISNLLFKHDQVHAIIDWDTTMAGHISWEFADLVRTSTINVPEDHPNAEDILLDMELLEGLSGGFKSVIFDLLSDLEKESLYTGTLYLIFEQAVRFLEDFLASNKYYKCDYEEHNLVRANNQFVILQRLVAEKTEILKCIHRG